MGSRYAETSPEVLVVLNDGAAADLENIFTYLDERSPGAASRLASDLRRAMEGLDRFPERGRPGLMPGTRELTAVWPYVIVYRITPASVQILRVLHGAQER